MSYPEELVAGVLFRLQEDELFALARTVTQGLLKFHSKEEALTAIVQHSPDAVSILRRKLVTKEILFGYLDEKGIKVKPAVTKNDLIDKVIEFWGTPTSNELATEPSPTGNLEMLANQFTGWFYSMLNSASVGPEHFYPNAHCSIHLLSDYDQETIHVQDDPDGITHALFRLRAEYNLTFNPNITQEGVQGRIDPHGLVMILACGTLHRNDMCAGVFEQTFSLVRDPACDNNWRVKGTEMNLRSRSDVVRPPKLYEGELTQHLAIMES